MDTCQGFFGRLFGHKFEAIFDEGPSTFPPYFEFNGPVGMVKEIVSISKQRTFRGIFCTRCGKREDK